MLKRRFPKFIYLLVCFLLIFQQSGFAQIAAELNIAGHLSVLHNSLVVDKFRPLHLRYLSHDSLNNNFKLLLDKGDLKNLKTTELEKTSKELLKYFFIGISLPNDSFWVNLRPDAQDNIIDDYLVKTNIGKIMLEADLQLKKDTAQATSPETPEGKEYWNKLYSKAGELFGSENITIPTLTRPWIVPDEIIIRETTDSAYVYKATLKVMLEQDYLKNDSVYNFKDERLKQLNEYSSQLIRELIIPKLTKEINISKRYAPLRQVYYSLILAQWFKSRNQNKDNQYSRLINRKDLTNLTSKEDWSKTTYFQAYKKSFKDGEYNIKEPVYTPYGQTIRSYLSGGISSFMIQPQVVQDLARPVGDVANKAVLPAARDFNTNSSPILAEIKVQVDNFGEIVPVSMTPAVVGSVAELTVSSSVQEKAASSAVEVGNDVKAVASASKVKDILNGLNSTDEILKQKAIKWVLDWMAHDTGSFGYSDMEYILNGTEYYYDTVRDINIIYVDDAKWDEKSKEGAAEVIRLGTKFTKIGIIQLVVLLPKRARDSKDPWERLAKLHEFRHVDYQGSMDVEYFDGVDFEAQLIDEINAYYLSYFDLYDEYHSKDPGLTFENFKSEIAPFDVYWYQMMRGLYSKIPSGILTAKELKEKTNRVIDLIIRGGLGHTKIEITNYLKSARKLDDLLKLDVANMAPSAAGSPAASSAVEKDDVIDNAIRKLGVTTLAEARAVLVSAQEGMKFFRGGALGAQVNRIAEEDTIGEGVYLTDEESAKKYASLRGGEKGEVKSAFIIGNILDLSETMRLPEDIMSEWRKYLLSVTGDSTKSFITQGAAINALEVISKGGQFNKNKIGAFTKAFSVLLQSKGYDGIKIWEGGEGTMSDHITVLIFNPKNVISSERIDSLTTEERSLLFNAIFSSVKNKENTSAGSPIIDNKGGIDFRFLPIVTQAMSNLSLNASRIPLSSLESVNLDQELQEIQKMVEAGITPSAERIKEYVQVSCLKGNSDMQKVVSCIADILRLEEERCCSTEATLKDILVRCEISSR